MCAIVGSFSKSKAKELYQLNSYRGELSYSLTTFRSMSLCSNVVIQLTYKSPGKIPDSLIDNCPINEGDYIITHSQAPTTSTKNIHPATCNGALLWHNGIIKQKTFTAETWDTEWLLNKIITEGWKSLSDVDGTFACIMYWNKKLYVFRNEISPLFIDKDMNISSTKTADMVSINPNKVYIIDMQNKKLDEVASFTTFENPYYIPEL